MKINEHRETSYLDGDDLAIFVSFRERPSIRKFSCYGNCLKKMRGSIHDDSVGPGPQELWIAGLIAMIIHLHFKPCSCFFLTGCSSVQQFISNVDRPGILGKCNKTVTVIYSIDHNIKLI